MKKLLIIALFLAPFLSFASVDQNLKYGMSGSDVSQLQDLLVNEGCLTVSPTGYFGLLTLNGVKCFQQKYDISPISGYFGALSREKANDLLSKDTQDSNVAEQEETGSVASLSSCSKGDLFDLNTGKPCTQIASSTVQLTNQINQLNQKIDNLTSTINTQTATAPVVIPPTVNATLDKVCVNNHATYNLHTDSNLIYKGTIKGTVTFPVEKHYDLPTSEINWSFANSGQPMVNYPPISSEEGSSIEYSVSFQDKYGNELKNFSGTQVVESCQ